MAEGLYKTTGKVAAVLRNPAPGSANLLPDAALHEGVPVLVITSHHRLGIVYPSLARDVPGTGPARSVPPGGEVGGPVFEWGRIPEVLRLAFREMWNGRPGPVHVEPPAPILYATGDDETAPAIPPAAYRGTPPQASDAQLSEAAELLACAERPVVSQAAVSTAPARTRSCARSSSCWGARS
jgi:acetolactate synthase-1/2/3 large subunit